MINKSIILGNEPEHATTNDLMQAPNGYFTNIKVMGLLEESDRADILNLVCSKLRKGGVLTLIGLDCLELSRRTFYGHIPVERFSQMIATMKRAHSLATLKQAFGNTQWGIRYAGLKEDLYFLEVIKK